MFHAKSDDRHFGSGENQRHLEDEQAAETEESIRAPLAGKNSAGLRFVDIGSGSGLFSPAARPRVHPFDDDPEIRAQYRAGLVDGRAG